MLQQRSTVRKGDILDIAITKEFKQTKEARERVSNFIERLKKKNV